VKRTITKLPRGLLVFLLLSFTFQVPAEMASLEFEGLQDRYCVGDTVVGDWVEIVPVCRQSLNSYRYMLNNPVSLQVSSESLFNKIWRGIKKVVKKVFRAVKNVAKAVGDFVARIFARIFYENTIDWTNPRAKVSKYFTVYEVTKGDSNRIPTEAIVQMNIVELAQRLDQLREAWGEPIGVRSWYRPPSINAAVGGKPNSLHIYGKAADIYPINGDIYSFQEFVQQNWSPGGIGTGASRGFVHVDIGRTRTWSY
jgi:hypothetical protein